MVIILCIHESFPEYPAIPDNIYIDLFMFSYIQCFDKYIILHGTKTHLS